MCLGYLCANVIMACSVVRKSTVFIYFLLHSILIDKHTERPKWNDPIHELIWDCFHISGKNDFEVSENLTDYKS